MTAELPASTLTGMLDEQAVIVYVPCVICGAPAVIAFVEPPRLICLRCGFDGQLSPDLPDDDLL
jgi:hypothetical protein